MLKELTYLSILFCSVLVVANENNESKSFAVKKMLKVILI